MNGELFRYEGQDGLTYVVTMNGTFVIPKIITTEKYKMQKFKPVTGLINIAKCEGFI